MPEILNEERRPGSDLRLAARQDDGTWRWPGRSQEPTPEGVSDAIRPDHQQGASEGSAIDPISAIPSFRLAVGRPALR